jgi:hypothetical protein
MLMQILLLYIINCVFTASPLTHDEAERDFTSRCRRLYQDNRERCERQFQRSATPIHPITNKAEHSRPMDIANVEHPIVLAAYA